MPIKLPAKQKGEWAEVCFAAEILRRGWRIARPYGDSAPYDCIVDVGAQVSWAKCLPPPASRPLLWRVQIKSVSVPDRDPRRNHHAGSSRKNCKLQISNYKCPRFHVTIGKGLRSKHCYSPHDVDFLAVLVVPLQTWYLIPLVAVRRQVSISLYPNRFRKFENFREAWGLLTTAG